MLQKNFDSRQILVQRKQCRIITGLKNLEMGKKKYQFLKKPPMERDLYTDKKNLSLIVGHNENHKKAYNDLLDKKLDMLQSTLDDLSIC